MPNLYQALFFSGECHRVAAQHPVGVLSHAYKHNKRFRAIHSSARTIWRGIHKPDVYLFRPQIRGHFVFTVLQ